MEAGCPHILPKGLWVSVHLLTALHGEDGEIVNGVDLSVQQPGCADDPSQGIDVEETLQVSVAVDGIPG